MKWRKQTTFRRKEGNYRHNRRQYQQRRGRPIQARVAFGRERVGAHLEQRELVQLRGGDNFGGGCRGCQGGAPLTRFR